jgi:signal peptidase II
VMFTACWPRASTNPGSLSLHAPLLVPVGTFSASTRLAQPGLGSPVPRLPFVPPQLCRPDCAAPNWAAFNGRSFPTVVGMAKRESAAQGEVLGAPPAPDDSALPGSVERASARPMESPMKDLAQPEQVEAEHPEPARLHRRQLPVLLAATSLALAADVISKLVVVSSLADRAPVVVIPRVLDLQLTRNAGAAFGLAGGATIIFTLVAAAVVVFIVATARRLRSRGWAAALGLLLGGALGNLGDRLFRDPGPLRGHVVDWIHLTHWPIFNLADSAIVVGGLLAVLLSMRGKRLDGTSVPTTSD